MALPSAVIRTVGMMLPEKHPVRTAATVTTPPEMVGPTQVVSALFGSLITPSSAVPTTPSGPLSRNEKSPFNSRLVGSGWVLAGLSRRIFFHPCPKEKEN